MIARAGHNAFSLLELVLVLVIIGIALAVVTPSLGGWSRGMKLSAAADATLAATRLARDRAVSSGVVHVLTLSSSQTVRVAPQEHEQALLADDAVTERVFELPEGVVIEAEANESGPTYSFSFYPDGRATPGILRLENERGDVLELECTSPAMGFAPREGVVR